MTFESYSLLIAVSTIDNIFMVFVMFSSIFLHFLMISLLYFIKEMEG